MEPIKSHIDEITSMHIRKFIDELDERIRQAFRKKGFDPTPEFIADRVTRVKHIDSPWEHYVVDAGKPTEVKVCAINQESHYTEEVANERMFGKMTVGFIEH